VRLIRLHLPEADATAALAAGLAPRLGAGMVVTLAGDLGAGKTTLVRGCLRALGWAGPVKSPTYGLVEVYRISSLYFYHFDFYRFEDPREWEDLGFAEYFRPDSICLIEWPERARGLVPTPDLAITLAHPGAPDGSGRDCTVTAGTPAGERCLDALTAEVDSPARKA